MVLARRSLRASCPPSVRLGLFLLLQFPFLACAEEHAEIGLTWSTGLVPSPAAIQTGGGLAELREANAEDAADLLSLLGYRGIHVAGRDLDVDVERLRRIAHDARVPLFSANVYDETTATPLCARSIRFRIGDRVVGLTGVTQVPDSPRKGLSVRDPMESLTEVLPDLARESNLVVVVACMDLTAACELVRRHPAVRLCVATSPGLCDRDPVRVGDSWVVQVPSAPRAGETVFRAVDPDTVEILHHHVVRPAVPGPEVIAACRKCGLLADPMLESISGHAPMPQAPDTAAAPLELVLDRPLATERTGRNRAVELSAHTICVRRSYGTLAAPANRLFLVIDAEWRNVLSPATLRERKMHPRVRIDDMMAGVFLRADRHACSLSPSASRLPGHLSVKNLTLERPGDTVRGNLVFEVDDPPPAALELRWYDLEHGDFVISLAGSFPEEASPDGRPRGSNGSVELLVRETRKEADPEPGGEGWTRLVVDLSGKSLVQAAGDATARDPAAKAGEKRNVGVPAAWSGAARLLRAIVDGERALEPLPGGTLPAEPYFLPDAATGGTIVFRVPKDARSIEIWCTSPRTAGDPSPRPIILPIEGEPPAQTATPLATAGTELQVMALGFQVVPQIEGRDPRSGKVFLSVDLVLVNAGETIAWFEAAKDLVFVDAKGRGLRPCDAGLKGTAAPPDPVWLPPGKRCRFTLSYEIPEPEVDVKLRLERGPPGKDLLDLGKR